MYRRYAGCGVFNGIFKCFQYTEKLCYFIDLEMIFSWFIKRKNKKNVIKKNVVNRWDNNTSPLLLLGKY